MKQNRVGKHLTAVLLAVCLLLQCLLPIGAVAGSQAAGLTWEQIPASEVSAELSREDAAADVTEPEAAPAADTPVRVSIVLEQPSVMEKGFALQSLSTDRGALAYRGNLEQLQQRLSRRISQQALGGQRLQVEWNLTLAANLISATVPYGAIAAIEAVQGVKMVVTERRYEIDDPAVSQPENLTSATTMTGTAQTWAEGYTGAGMRVAVVDTGVDTDHQSFDSDAFLYSLYQQGAQAVADGKYASVDEYMEALDLLDAEEILSVLYLLNATERFDGMLAAEKLYVSEKLPFNFNYVDADLDVTHDNDTQSGHGSHVAGIAGANAYVPDGQGGYAAAAETVYVVGQAPDAQVLNMKVAGKNGGIYDSDYMAALEDALVLGCDAVNMSFGSTAVGYANSGNEYYDRLYASLQGTDLVLTNSGGNAYSYAEFAVSGIPYLFADDVNNGRIGSPSAYPNALSVASVDNTGFTGPTTSVLGREEVIFSVTDSANAPAGFRSWYSLDATEEGSGTEYPFVFLGDPSAMLQPGYQGEDPGNYYGVPADFEGLDLTGKIVLVARGNGVAFTDKLINAVAAGAEAVLVYNNTSGTINMDMSASTVSNPCAFMQLADAVRAFAAATRDESGLWGGTLQIKRSATILYGEPGAPLTMSDFSSWGVPDTLTMKPEITAAGGNIYSVDGEDPLGLDYVSMSGTSMSGPQVAGMSALLLQYIQENELCARTGLSARTLAQSLLMGTALPIIEEETGLPYSIRRQGAGLASVDRAVSAGAYLLVGEQAGNDGKVKVEFGDDPSRSGQYEIRFSIHNLLDSPLRYTVDAQLMAPGCASDGRDLFMLNTMVPLEAEMDFRTDCAWISYDHDFDGDLDVDEDDVQLLLDYVTGGPAPACNLDYADVSGNGIVDAFDAYALLDCVESGCHIQDYEILVPAGGSAQVEVSLQLSQESLDYINECFENGTYVEGFVHVIPLADAEGALDVSQSIPLLGFCGNWSDGSMYERGEYTQDFYHYLNGTPTRFYSSTANTVNMMATKIDGQLYSYGLNYFTIDDEYLPQRASLSAANGDSLARIYYALIRNSVGTRVQITDDATGEVYFKKDLGQQLAAFYYLNGGLWQNNALTASVNWKGTDANGEPLPDGTRATVSLISASEYYLNADGSIRWDELSDGAYYSMPVLIDNVAPEMFSAHQVVDAVTGESLCQMVVQDNHYLAAASLLNSTGSKVLGTIPVNQTQEGEEKTLVFGLQGVIGTEFIMAFMDYAGNTSYYRFQLLADTNFGNLYGFSTDFDSWVNFGTDVDGNETVIATTDKTFVAGDYAEGFLFAVDQNGELYATDMEDLSVSHPMGRLLYDYIGLAYDDLSGKLFGARCYGNGKTYLYDISLVNATERFSRTLDVELAAIAAVGDGSFYGITALGDVYHVGQELRLIGNVGCSLEGTQSLTVSGDRLLWASGTELLEISLEDGSCSLLGRLSGPTTCLVSITSAGGSFSDGDKATSLVLNRGQVTGYQGNTVQLEARVRPWYAEDKTVTWSSSNEAVASVDENGLVRLLSLGQAEITATSNLSPEVSASCLINVESLELTIAGLTNLDGAGTLIYRDLFTGESLELPVSGLEEVVSATRDEANNALWVMDENGAIHRVDPQQGSLLQTVESGSGLVLDDITAGVVYEGFYGVTGAMITVATAYEENTPGSGFDLSSYLAQNTGASHFVAVANLGAGTANGSDCDVLLAMDNAGTIWQLFVYSTGSGYSASLGLVSTGLAGKIPAGARCTAAYAPDYGTAGGLLFAMSVDGGTEVYVIDAGNTTNVQLLSDMPYESLALYTPQAPAAEELPAQSLPMISQLLEGSVLQAVELRSAN